MGESKKSGFLNRDEAILVVVDMQEKLIPVIFDNKRITENIIKLLRFASVINLPVLVCEQEKLGPTIQTIRDEIRDFNPIPKIEFDAMKCLEFSKKLKEFRKKCVIITGIESHVCITQTVLHLLPDYEIHVISDAISSRTQDNYHIAIERMKDNGATISSTEMVIFELLEKAGTAEFKATLPIVK